MKLILIILSGTLFLSCNNKLDIIDNYRETPVIYGLLNLSDSIQYIRVQKAYLGEGNALLMAQYSDSIYYDTSDISVRLSETVNGISTRIIPLFTDDTQPKDDGLFVNYPHIVYRTPGIILNKDAQYKLSFTNKKTGKNVTGVTKLVGNLQTPTVLAFPYINLANDNPLAITLYPAKNAKVYGLHIMFNYQEKKRTDPGTIYQYKSIDYLFPDIVTTSNNPTQTFSFSLKGADFYSFIASKIPIDTSLIRPALFTSMDFIFTVGAEDFYIYYSINQPSNNLNQNIPDFTNLSDGKGIFSSRNKNIFPHIQLNNASTDSLVYGTFTSGRFSY